MHFIYLFRSTTQWCRVYTQSTLICEAEKKSLYSSAEKSHAFIAQVVKQAITKNHSGRNVNSKVNIKLAHRKCIVQMNAFEIKILTSISHANQISLNVF